MDQSVSFTVPNISCGGCVATIERVVSGVKGVTGVTGDPETKRVDVTFTPPADREGIVQVMSEWDYPPAEERADE